MLYDIKTTQVDAIEEMNWSLLTKDRVYAKSLWMFIASWLPKPQSYFITQTVITLSTSAMSGDISKVQINAIGLL